MTVGPVTVGPATGALVTGALVTGVFTSVALVRRDLKKFEKGIAVL